MKRITAFLLTVLLLLSLAACGGKGTWQEQYNLGMRYLNEGNYQEAIIAFEAAIKIDPKRPEAYLGAAEAYVGLGDTDAARKILEQGFQATRDERLSNYLPNEVHLQLQNSDGNADYGDLTVVVKDSRSATITIHNLAMQDTYLTNLSSSVENEGEYLWHVEMHLSDGTAYSVSTSEWASGEGERNVELPITQMQHSAWVQEDSSWHEIDNVEMQYTSDSISWTFSIPEEYPFDFAKVAQYGISIHNAALDENLEKTYLVD